METWCCFQSIDKNHWVDVAVNNFHTATEKNIALKWWKGKYDSLSGGDPSIEPGKLLTWKEFAKTIESWFTPELDPDHDNLRTLQNCKQGSASIQQFLAKFESAAERVKGLSSDRLIEQFRLNLNSDIAEVAASLISKIPKGEQDFRAWSKEATVAETICWKNKSSGSSGSKPTTGQSTDSLSSDKGHAGKHKQHGKPFHRQDRQNDSAKEGTSSERKNPHKEDSKSKDAPTAPSSQSKPQSKKV